MKTEKKSNEPSCISSAVVKEEPDGDSVKIKEEIPGGNHEDAPGDDTTECSRDPNLDSSNGEATMPNDTQNGTGNQAVLGLIKQENDHNNPNDDITSGKSLFIYCYLFLNDSCYVKLFHFNCILIFGFIRWGSTVGKQCA